MKMRGAMELGVVKIDITPEEPVELAGFGWRKGGFEVAEGGYEGRDSYIYFGLPAPLSESVEMRLTSAVDELLGNMQGMRAY
jgi:hypothetical protein